MLHKAWNSKGEVPNCFPRSSIKFQGHTGQNITNFDPNWAFPDYRPVAAFKSLRFALLCKCLHVYTKIYHKLLVAVCVRLRSFGILYWQQNYYKQHNDCYDNTTFSEFSMAFCADFAMYNILPPLQCINEVSQIVSPSLSNIRNCIMSEASGSWLPPDKSQWEAALWGGFGFCLNPSYWCRQYWLKLSGSGTIRFWTPKVLQDFERSHWWFRMFNKH